jgi:hypothetical protein
MLFLSFTTIKKCLLKPGKHFYKIECDDIKTQLRDSFYLKEDSYLFLIFQRDLIPVVGKDSLSITFMTKNQLDQVEFL